MTTGNGKVTRWWRNDKIIAADESNDKPFSCIADEVWGDVDANKLYNPNPLSIDEVLEMQRQKREAEQKYGEDWRPKAVTTFMQAANNARDKDANFKNLSQKDGKSYQQDDIVFESNGDGDLLSVAMSSLGDDSVSNTNEKMISRKKDKSVNPTVYDYEDDKLESEVEQSVSLKHGNTSSPGSDSHGKSSAKILPSNTGKSTDTEGVERQLYLEDSSGAVFTPPEIDVLVGGKRKGRKVRNKRVKKKNKSKNDKVHGGCRVISTAPNKDKQRDCMKTAVESLLITTKEKELILCSSNPFPIPSDDGGDVSIEQGNRWLMEHGMILESIRTPHEFTLVYND